MLFAPVSVGCFAISKKGHDKGQCYVLVGALNNGFALVADGKKRTLTAPKRKNARHLFITKTKVADYENLIVAEPVSADLKLAAAIKVFRQKHGTQAKSDVTLSRRCTASGVSRRRLGNE